MEVVYNLGEIVEFWRREWGRGPGKGGGGGGGGGGGAYRLFF